MNRFFTRIVTFLAHPRLGDTPREMLMLGSQIITLNEKRRWFVVRKVFYDDSMMPQYSMPELNEQWYESVQELREKRPDLAKSLFNAPILDRDNGMKVYEDNSRVVTNQ